LKNVDYFLTFAAAKVHVFRELVTGLVTDLATLGTDPVLALPLRNSMYLSRGLVYKLYLLVTVTMATYNALNGTVRSIIQHTFLITTGMVQAWGGHFVTPLKRR